MSDNSTIQRCPHDSQNPYTMILNDLIRDASISPNCRWLLIYLLSNKDGWTINVSQIHNHVKDHIGRDKIRKIIDEAIQAGYIKRENFKQGNLNRLRYFVSERPKFKEFLPRPDFQGLETKAPDSTPTKNKQSPKNTYVNKDNVRKKTMASCTHDKKDNGKALSKFKLSDEQSDVFAWLKSLSLNTDDNTLAYWAKTFSLARLNAVYDCAKKGAKSNIGGYMNALLKKNAQVETEQSKINKQTAKNFKMENGFGAMTILENYVRIDLFGGSTTDISYQLDPLVFFEQLIKYHEL